MPVPPLAALVVVELVLMVAPTLVLLLVLTAAEEVDPEPPEPLVQVGTALGPVGVSSIASLARTQPLLAVSAAGHATCLKVIAGLSALRNQSKRQ